MIEKLKDTIIKLLTQKPETRDNDQLLQCYIWNKEFRSLYGKPAENELGIFFNAYHSKKLSNASSIKRCRAKIQELCPELRGEMYDKRHTKSLEVRREVKVFNVKQGELL